MRRVRWVVVALATACTTARAQAAAPWAPGGTAAAPSRPDLRAKDYAQIGVSEASQQSPLATVAIDAGYGGIAGLLVGTGVALAGGGHWGRDLSVGAGVGLIVGAAFGVVHATVLQPRYADAGAGAPPSARAGDGLGRTDRDPVITAPTVLGLAGRY